MNIFECICVFKLYLSLILSHPFARGLLPAAYIHNECNRHKEGNKSPIYLELTKEILPTFSTERPRTFEPSDKQTVIANLPHLALPSHLFMIIALLFSQAVHLEETEDRHLEKIRKTALVIPGPKDTKSQNLLISSAAQDRCVLSCSAEAMRVNETPLGQNGRWGRRDLEIEVQSVVFTYKSLKVFVQNRT